MKKGQMNPSHLALRPNEVDRPAGKTLEDFCLELGRILRSQEEPVFLYAELIAHWFRWRFNLYPPVMPNLGQLLDELGIDWATSYAIESDEPASYTYDWQKSQWCITTRTDAGLMESIHILHELYELFWWRCYYLLPEWKEWVEFSNMNHPHPTADEFARDLVLHMESFGSVAQEFKYNPIMLAGRYQTAAGICFQTFLRVNFPVPYIQVRLDTVSRQAQSSMDLFEDAPAALARIHTKGAKFHTNHSLRKWTAMFHLREHLPCKNTFVPVEDWICKAILRGFPTTCETDRLLGIQLPKPVFAVVRPRFSKPFLQVVPVSRKELLIDEAIEAQFFAEAVLSQKTLTRHQTR
jgi:hypothetical protein